MNYLIYIFAFLTVFGYVITSIVQLLKSNYFKFFRATSLVKLSLKNTILLVKKNYKFFASVIMLNLNLYVDNFFISSLANGNISKYNIIIKVPDVFQSLLVSSIAVVFFNIIAKDKNQAKSLFIKFSYFFAIVFLTGLAFVNIFGVEVLYLIYGVDAFAGLDELQIKKILLITTANVFFMVSIALLFKIFIINEKSNFIFISSSVNVLINIIANYLLINNYELLGIASSTLIANFVFYIILFFRINKFKQKINPKFKKL
jgi:peptidoglycan biosynthesis protein MviN/MurJ (putative lipid II flippase)